MKIGPAMITYDGILLGHTIGCVIVDYKFSEQPQYLDLKSSSSVEGSFEAWVTVPEWADRVHQKKAPPPKIESIYTMPGRFWSE